jgi:hypothetical protein
MITVKGEEALAVTRRAYCAGGLGLEPRLQGTKGLRAADYPISQ